MGKRGAHSGESPKDRSINIIDKFISRNNSKQRFKNALPGRRKDKDIPVYMWPLKDQIAYYENKTDRDYFEEKYKCYSTWYDEVKQLSGVYPTTFMDFIATKQLKPKMREMFDTFVKPKDAIYELRKHGIY
tara:strand:+ start:991 stop:1383 length:393 start_codon:yes stop_codon:yes gene_type:complete